MHAWHPCMHHLADQPACCCPHPCLPHTTSAPPPGPDCSRPLLQGCHSSLTAPAPLPHFSNTFPKNCRCFEQLHPIACPLPPLDDQFGCLNQIFTTWKHQTCYTIDGFSTDQQHSRLPEAGGVRWHQGAWAPNAQAVLAEHAAAGRPVTNFSEVSVHACVRERPRVHAVCARTRLGMAAVRSAWRRAVGVRRTGGLAGGEKGRLAAARLCARELGG